MNLTFIDLGLIYIHAFLDSVIFIIYVRFLRFSLFVDPIGILVFKARSPGKFRVINAPTIYDALKH